MKSIFIALLIIGTVGWSVVAYAGCPIDVTDLYDIKNVTCVANCEDVVIRNDGYPKDVYFYENKVKCATCNELIIVPRRNANGDSTIFFQAYGTVDGKYSSLDSLLVNGKPVDSDHLGVVKFKTVQEMFGSQYILKIASTVLEVRVKDTGHIDIVDTIQCLEGCEHLHVITYNETDHERIVYNSCAMHVCKNIVLHQQSECGGGYGVSASTNLVYGEYDPALGNHVADQKYFSKNQMSDQMVVTSTLLGTEFEYELVRNPEASALNKVRVDEAEQERFEVQGIWESGKRFQRMLFIVSAILLLVGFVLKIVYHKKTK
ncbi:MAG: hypothetical protein KBD73_03605 [Candidatus Magasanikbacteria bacterium]|nr:hypothetical protein [Candidatus Magasanikbacteria bacterium]